MESYLRSTIINCWRIRISSTLHFWEHQVSSACMSNVNYSIPRAINSVCLLTHHTSISHPRLTIYSGRSHVLKIVKIRYAQNFTKKDVQYFNGREATVRLLFVSLWFLAIQLIEIVLGCSLLRSVLTFLIDQFWLVIVVESKQEVKR